MAKNLEELRAENPELAEALMSEAKAAVSASAGGGTPAPQPGPDAVSAAVQAEQKRIQEIDAVASLYDAETVKAAKYGENACTAQEMLGVNTVEQLQQVEDYIKTRRGQQ